ncbi:MAG: acyl-CoA dehydrogenase family protein [Bacteroidetes bacterium]|nr:acyl-CoA dehydrogenase family protein [Bacteroidota bacterium]
MKSLYFTEEHDLFRDSIRAFVQKEIVPYGIQWEKEKKIPKELLKKLGEQGYLGINHAEAYGGTAADFFYSVTYLEELCKCGFGGVTAMISVHQFMATNHLAEAGSDALKKKYLTRAIQGEMLAAIAVTEPGGGSDVSAMLTTAVKDGDEYVINGSKTFITNGVHADFVVVSCKTNPAAGVNGISLIIVEKGTKGFTATNLEKMGWHSSDTGELAFDNVRVPVSNRIGEENMGFFYIMESFQLERLVAGIMANAASEHVLNETLKYMDERETFGRKIKKYQVLRHDIVNLFTELEAAKHLAYYTSWQFDNGMIPVKECSMVKLHCTELSNRVIDTCFQMYGGYAFMEEYPIARAYRDARIGTIVGGTSQIMREILAKMIIDDVQYKKVYKEEKEGSESTKSLSAKDIILSLSERLKADRAEGVTQTFNFDISGDGGGQFTVNVNNGSCTVTEGLSESADCTVSSVASVYEEVELGKLSPETAVMSGQLKISNLMAMMSFSKLFRRVNG